MEDTEIKKSINEPGSGLERLDLKQLIKSYKENKKRLEKLELFLKEIKE